MKREFSISLIQSFLLQFSFGLQIVGDLSYCLGLAHVGWRPIDSKFYGSNVSILFLYVQVLLRTLALLFQRMSEKGRDRKQLSTFIYLVMWEFGSLHDSNMGLKWLGLVLGKFLSLNLFQNIFLYMLCISNSFSNYKGLRLGDQKGIDVQLNIFALYCLLVGFHLGHFCVYIYELTNTFGFGFFKLNRNFISIVGMGLGPLLFKLNNSLLIG